MGEPAEAARGGVAQQAQQAGQQGAVEQLVFLYRLVLGHAGPSFGLYCAQSAGVPQAVLERASHVITTQVGELS